MSTRKRKARRDTDPAALKALLRALKLPSFVNCCDEMIARANKQGWSWVEFLSALAEQEIQDRQERKIIRLRRKSKLPEDKTLDRANPQWISDSVRRLLPSLTTGEFADRGENILIFGLQGRGKTHVACIIGHALVDRGIPVLFTKTVLLVQQLLIAKRDLELESALRKLDRFAVIILDDIGYVQHSREEMEVLFTFLAERYERKSVVITSNLVFKDWGKIFKDPMTTAAAIDRVVHHSTIIELTGPSIRKLMAEQRRRLDNGGKGGRS